MQVCPPLKVLHAEAVQIVDKSGTLRAIVDVGDDGIAAITFLDGKGVTRAMYGLSAEDRPAALMMDGEKTVWSAP